MNRYLSVTLLSLAGCNNTAEIKPAPAPSASAVPHAAAFVATSGAASGAVVEASAPAPRPTRTDTFVTPGGELGVTPIHHASLLLEYAGKTIYLDPAGEVSFEGLPKADIIFITDVHQDHLDAAGVAKVKKDGTILVGPPAVSEKMPMGVVMKNGDTHDFGTFKVDAVPMYNLTRGPAAGKLFHDKGRGDGYVFTFGKAGAKTDAKTDAGANQASRLYVAGDTECTPEMTALKNIDIAFVPMNLPYTMPPAEAVACVNAFKPKVVFPFHHRGSNLEEFTRALAPTTEARVRTWY